MPTLNKVSCILYLSHAKYRFKLPDRRVNSLVLNQHVTCVSRGRPKTGVDPLAFKKMGMIWLSICLTQVAVCLATIERPMGVAISSK